jgi:2-dehydro-3-deoxygluconokinase
VTTFDVVTFGETMLRLTPPNHLRLEQASHLEMHVGGSESNVAVGLSRLGVKTAWVSRLTDNVIGRHIERTLMAQGIDTQHVVWTDEDRVGVYFLEEGSAMRGGMVTYDRANSAMSRIRPEHLPEDLFQPKGSRLLHLSGITPALSPEAAGATLQAATLAKDSGWLVSFDFNYRRLLWSEQEAAAGCEPIAKLADVLFIAIRDANAFYGLSAESHEKAAFEVMREKFPQAILIITLGAMGSAVSVPDRSGLHYQAAFPADPNGQVGRGDAFVAGFLFEFLRSENSFSALKWGSAAAALKSTVWGDMPLFTYAEVARVVESSGGEARILR